MFDDQKQKLIHQITVPDNTFGIFCHYDQETKTVSIYVGDFASDNVIDTDENGEEDGAPRQVHAAVGELDVDGRDGGRGEVVDNLP